MTDFRSDVMSRAPNKKPRALEDLLSAPLTAATHVSSPAAEVSALRTVKVATLTGQRQVTSSQIAVPDVIDEGDDTNETISMLRRRVDTLKVELAEKEWAAVRARELGTALDILTEENAKLRSEKKRLMEQVEELESLRQAQQVLLAVADEGQVDYRRIVKLLDETSRLMDRDDDPLHVTAASPVAPHHGKLKDAIEAPPFKASCRELMDACRAVARWGPSVCPACLATKEDRSRGEMVLKERSAWQSITGTWDAIFATQRYCAEQYTDHETERMWQEDMLSHRLSVMKLQEDLNKQTRLAQEASHFRQVAEFWRQKCRDTDVTCHERIKELQATHQQQLTECRRRSVASAQDANLIRFLFVSNVKTFLHSGKLLLRHADVRKELLEVQAALEFTSQQLLAQLADLRRFCFDTIKLIMPCDWAPVPKSKPTILAQRGRETYGGGGSALRSLLNPGSNVKPPTLSDYDRKAIVRRSSSAPRRTEVTIL